MQQFEQRRGTPIKLVSLLIMAALLIISSFMYSPVARAEDPGNSSNIYLPLVTSGESTEPSAELGDEVAVNAASTSISKFKSFSGQIHYTAIGNTESAGEASNNCTDVGPTSASLNMPSGSSVQAAYLYWSGSGSSTDTHVKLNGSSVNAARTFSTSLYANSRNYYFYGAFADVTHLVNSNGNYQVSNLSWANYHPYCNFYSAYGGWSLVVVYQNSSLPISDIDIYDGFKGRWPQGTLTHHLGGLSIPTGCSLDVKLTHISWEGDSYKGEHFYINNHFIGDNTYNGSTSPNLDIDTYNISNKVNPGSSSISVSTTNYWVGNSLEWFINNVYIVKSKRCPPTPTPTKTPTPVPPTPTPTKTPTPIPPTPTPTKTPTPIPLASLGDKVWKDLDRDGIQDDNEPGVDGVTVNLLDGNGNQIDSTTTNNGGMYSFSDLEPGDYIVEFEAPANMPFTDPNQGGDDSRDSDANPNNGRSPVISLGPGENDDTVDAGLVNAKASLGDKVWKDLDRDGIQDDNEPGVDGVTVNLLDDNGNQIDSTTTSNGGMYSFSDLEPGDYIVEFEAPANMPFTDPNQGGDDSKDSDANPNNGRTNTINLGPGENDNTVDAGLVNAKASLGDKVWKDLDRDGIQDDGEPGVDGVTVNLLDDNGNQIDSTTTSNGGMYSFSDLEPGDYIVEFEAMPNMPFTDPNQGGDDSKDSDANPNNGRSPVISLGPGENDDTVDAGLQPAPSQDLTLGDTVFLDENNNGKQDAGEPGIAGVAVKLYPDNNDNGSPDSGAIATVTTDGNGNYLFTGLEPGKYIVEIGTTNFNPGRPLEGLVSSNGGGSEPAPDPDNDVDGDDNGTETTTGSGKRVVRSGTIMLSVGDEPTSEDGDDNTNLTLDFGFIEDTGPVLEASIDIEKSTNGEDADFPTGPGIPVGNQVNFEYVITNDGDFDLVNVVVDDDQLGQICIIDDLPVGASATCTAQDTAIQGQYSNIGTATGEPVDANGNPATDPDGNPIPDPSDSDPSHYVGITPTGCVSGDMLMIEAEDGNLEGRFEIGDDPAASSGQYIHVPNGLGNEFSLNLKDRAEFCFTVSMAGTYRIKGLVYAETGLDNSFFVTVDGQPANGYIWDFSKNTNYNEDFVSDRNGADPVEVELTPGDHIITIYLREDGGRLDKIFLEKVNGGGEPPECGGLIQEGEDGMLFGLFEIGNDPAASGGKFVHVPNGSGNSTNLNSQQRVDYCVNIEESGVYRIKANIYAASGADNSFFVQVDGSPSNGYLWDIPLSTDYDLDFVSDRNGADPVQVILDAGEHTISVLLREDGARLDKFTVQKIFDTSSSAVSSQVHELGHGVSGVLRIESIDGNADNSNLSLSGVTFTLSDAASNGSNYQATVQPDAQGRYSFDNVPVGEYILTVHVPVTYTTEQATESSVSVTAEQPVDISFDIMSQEMEHSLFLPVVTR